MVIFVKGVLNFFLILEFSDKFEIIEFIVVFVYYY